ncbi:hypothetical protein Acr_00g0023400 [Actinidia rufa]|uniref:Uncharacterized protein n=1 Tax=Actinidia rufa TaxID=165716 RepID=A0A7J0DD09_9ERIC|nr:hypothetical protein Acr_00g0023400 [Actinidia rufa]
MEEGKQIEPNLEQDQSKEEETNNHVEIGEEIKVIPMIEATQLEDVKEHGHTIGPAGGQTETLKKSKQGSKQDLKKPKVTIPQPFSFTTERRMFRQRRGSMDFKEYMPTLSRSGSLNCKALSQSSIGPEGTSNLSRVKSIKTNLPPKATTGEPLGKRVENGPKAKDKTQGKESEKKKPHVEAKIQSSQIKPPWVVQESKSVAKSGDSKGKMLSRTIRSSARETMSKLLKTMRKSPVESTPNHVVVKLVVSSA